MKDALFLTHIHATKNFCFKSRFLPFWSTFTIKSIVNTNCISSSSSMANVNFSLLSPSLYYLWLFADKTTLRKKCFTIKLKLGKNWVWLDLKSTLQVKLLICWILTTIFFDTNIIVFTIFDFLHWMNMGSNAAPFFIFLRNIFNFLMFFSQFKVSNAYFVVKNKHFELFYSISKEVSSPSTRKIKLLATSNANWIMETEDTKFNKT